MPSNFSFQLLNVVKDPWPFASDTFDIVHCRLLAMHIPQFRELIDKAIDATAPGGILMFEDTDLDLKSDSNPVPPEAKLSFKVYHAYCATIGVDAQPGPKFAPHIIASKKFIETHETVVPAPMGEWSNDDKLRSIGLGMQHGVLDAAQALHARLFQFGMTKKVIDDMTREALNGDNRLYMDMYFVWARKKTRNV